MLYGLFGTCEPKTAVEMTMRCPTCKWNNKLRIAPIAINGDTVALDTGEFEAVGEGVDQSQPQPCKACGGVLVYPNEILCNPKRQNLIPTQSYLGR